MEIQDIIMLMQAVSENGLTGFKLEEGDTKLSIKKEVQQVVSVEPQSPYFSECGVEGMPGFGANASSQAYTSNPAYGSNINNQTEQNISPQAPEGIAIDSDNVVISPLVGTFYTSASPEAEAFVKVGDSVKKGQTLGIIEAMKLMNEIECEYDGVVEAVLACNEDVVEYGQPLFRIR